MMNTLRTAGQFALILALFVGVAALSNYPVYRQTPAGTGVVILTFVHGADRRAACRTLTPEERAKLPPNMRRTQVCPRGRPPLYVELDVDGRAAFRADLPPMGFAKDGPSKVYQRFVLPAGEHEVAVRMRDTPRTEGFDHERNSRISLGQDRLVVIDFRPEGEGFVIR